MADPWAADWGDDWTKPLQEKHETPAEVWRQANDTRSQPVRIADVAPSIGYKPAVKILKRQAIENQADQSNTVILSAAEKAKIQATEKALREQRYKEARERLFGATTSAPVHNERPAMKGLPPAQASHAIPERQARGPDADGRRGFGARVRGRGSQIE